MHSPCSISLVDARLLIPYSTPCIKVTSEAGAVIFQWQDSVSVLLESGNQQNSGISRYTQDLLQMLISLGGH